MDAAITEDCHDWQPPSPAELEPIFPHFKDFSYIDRGGMGAIYKATQISLKRPVAIKILAPELSDDETFVSLFEKEGIMLGKLQHPQIVTVYESGRTSEGHLYLVMEFVNGKALLEHLRAKKLALTQALDYTAQVCDALIYAHGCGVMHLDIKPGNILIDDRDLVRVADFGLARMLANQDEDVTGERSHGFLGTVGYAAPEQRSKTAAMDQRADIYSLGVTLHEMLTGLLPKCSLETSLKNANLPTHVEQIIRKCLQEKPEDRFQSAKELRQAIAKSMLRLGTPLIQRAVISRPIVSMITCIMVGMAFIFLLDALSHIKVKQTPALSEITRDSPDTTRPFQVIPLSHPWAVTEHPMALRNIQSALSQHPDWELAEIHSEAEQKQVSELLQVQQITAPLWLGARLLANPFSLNFEWYSGAPVEFKHLMPNSRGRPIIITEIQASGWIEVYNQSNEPTDLTGYHLIHYHSDAKGLESMKQIWINASSKPEKLPMILQPQEYRLIRLTGKASQNPMDMHLNFELETKSGRLEFYFPQGLACQIFRSNWNDFPADASLGLAPDGQSWGWCEKPTPGSPNAPLKATFASPIMNGQPKSGLVMLPEFNHHWSRLPLNIPSRALLKRAAKN
jgi:serine/threonine protein kinase